MSSKKKSKARKFSDQVNDFDDVLTHLKSSGAIEALPPQIKLDTLRRIHKCVFAVLMWRRRLHSTPEQAILFLAEMSSDAVQVIPQVSLGYYKASSLLVRGMLENLLRYIYFYDHPIEFTWINSGWYLSRPEYVEYMCRRPLLSNLGQDCDVKGLANGAYSALSGSVHGGHPGVMTLHEALEDIKYVQADANSLTRNCETVARLICITFISLHYQQFGALPQKERSFLLSFLTQKQRRRVRQVQAD